MSDIEKKDKTNLAALGCFAFGCIVIVLMALSYLCVTGLFWLACYGFDLEFSWLRAFAVWLLAIFIGILWPKGK